MKKYLRLITITLLLTGIAYSCKKDSNPVCKIITVSSPGSDALNFTYNSEGELISVSSGAVVTSLVYTGNTITTITNNAGVFYSKKIITLNSTGLASNARIETNPAGTIWENYAYEYNGSEVIKDTYTKSTGGAPVITTYTWSAGNLVTISAASTTTFGYYTDKAAQGDYLSLSQLQEGYQIVRNKNALKSMLAGATIYNFDYTMDADKKITSVIATGAMSSTFNYQYQCN